jgi:hypothetical protein
VLHRRGELGHARAAQELCTAQVVEAGFVLEREVTLLAVPPQD